ncbi:MAG: SIMPL domain-containing protein, partial [Bacteroidales bacterium]|nr:SIMPL domain-containing protein [Bacteroidales bacterium]
EKVNHSKIDQFRREVKVNAIKVAREKAIDMAQAIGQNADKAIYIQEIEYNNYSLTRRSTANIMVKMTTADSLDSEAVPDIEFEKIKLEYQVNAKFELN